jgi:hypothetical protein
MRRKKGTKVRVKDYYDEALKLKWENFITRKSAGKYLTKNLIIISAATSASISSQFNILSEFLPLAVVYF